MKKILENKYLKVGLLVAAGILIGWFMKPSSKETTSDLQNNDNKAIKEQIWTCSMHPQIRQNKPGKCPICGMDLIPLNNEGNAAENPLAVTMSPVAMQLANIQTSVVSKQKPIKEVRMTGKVQANETKVFSQASHFPGRIEQLAINYTGEQVQKGQSLALVYSPDLITAQEELFEAMKIKDQQPALYGAAKEKLKNWKLTDAQIDQIIADGKPQEKFPVLADVSGVVLKKRVNTGDYLMKGMAIYDIADLSSVWILFDVYESDMPWIKTGSKVDFTVPSLPGEIFSGTISFIDPVINPQTRVAKARVEFPNAQGKLKPEMFVSGIVKSELEWNKKDLTIPKSAILWTGKRSVVYVKGTTGDGVSFIMREVTLGPSLGDSYIVMNGLEEGEEIVTNGAFSVDAAAQLSGKPSMMNPEGGPVVPGHNHGTMTMPKNQSGAIETSKKIKDALSPLFNTYFNLKNALVADDFEKSKEMAASLLVDISKVDMGIFSAESHKRWMMQSSQATKALQAISTDNDISQVRNHFITLSESFIMMGTTFGPFDNELYIMNCPMANDDKGADWISNEKKIKNPYMGKKMLSCGSVVKTIK